MKKFVLTSLAVTALSLTSYSQAKKLPIKSTGLEAEFKFEQTPIIQSDKNEVPDKKKWLTIATTYETIAEPIKGSRDRFGYIDGLRVKYEILMPISYKGKNILALMTGNVEYWAVRKDGEKHYMKAFIPAQVIERYRRSDMKMRRSDAEKILGRITFYDKNQRPIAIKYVYPRKSSRKVAETYFKKYTNSVEGGLLRLENVVLGKDKTPWSTLSLGKYELIKFDGNK